MDIQRVGVIGAGQMGRGIAQVAAQAGLDVVVLDASVELAEAAFAQLGKTLARLVDKGKIDSAARDAALGRITATSGYTAVADCDIVIEAAPENEALKREIFTALDQAVKPDAILASNTSSISITTLAASTQGKNQPTSNCT